MNVFPSQSNFKQALTKISAICSRSEKCAFDIVQKLKSWELSDEEISKAFKFLIEEKYLDNSRFATSFVRDKFRFNKWGKVKIAYMLRQKRIAENLIFNALDEISETSYHDTITALLKAKARSIKDKNSYERLAKLATFGQSHGFEADLCMKTARKILGNEEVD